MRSRLMMTQEAEVAEELRKPDEGPPADGIALSRNVGEASTIEQWRAVSESLRRFNDALLRIGELEAEAMKSARRAE